MMLKKFHEAALDEIYVPGSNEEVFSGRLLKVQRDHVTLPNGNDTTREYIRHPGAVAIVQGRQAAAGCRNSRLQCAGAIVPVLADGSGVLVKQCRYPLGTLLWEIPAGKLDHGPEEDTLECAKRELSEETGYDAGHWEKLTSIATTPGLSDEIIHLYKAWGLQKFAQHTDEDEFIGVQAFTPAELRRMVADGELYDAKTLCALYAAKVI